MKPGEGTCRQAGKYVRGNVGPVDRVNRTSPAKKLVKSSSELKTLRPEGAACEASISPSFALRRARAQSTLYPGSCTA